MITLTHVTGPERSKTLRYKTLAGARKAAHALVGPSPRIDRDGWHAIGSDGSCLFAHTTDGDSFEELFGKLFTGAP